MGMISCCIELTGADTKLRFLFRTVTARRNAWHIKMVGMYGGLRV
jgi:hypothetical protein